MTGLIREEPPSPSVNMRLSVKYADELAKVRAEPGEWFRLLEYSGKWAGGQASKAASVLRGQTSGYEFRVSGARVYVRWTGEVCS